MKHGLVWVFGPMAATIVLLHADAAGLASAWAADIAPHRALYSMSLGQTHGDAGVTGAGGTMAYHGARVATAGPSSSATGSRWAMPNRPMSASPRIS